MSTANNHTFLKKINSLLAHFRKLDARYAGLELPLRSLREFSKVSISTREDLLKFSKQHALKGAFNLTATSGTTETRLLIAHSRRSYEMQIRRLVKLYKSIGVSRGDICLNTCSYELNSGGRLMETAYKALGVGVIPLGVLDSPEKKAEAVALVRMLKPTVVNSYTNQLFSFFAALGKDHGIRCCVVNGEPLYPSFKKQIETMAGVQIFDHYGAMEFAGFAIAQNHDDKYMRISEDGLHFEVLKDNGRLSSTGTGSLLVTDLLNDCQPFIRYRLGDKVELIRRKGALWIKVLGRLSDSILVDGVVHSRAALVRLLQEAIGHPEFFILIDKDPCTYRDKIILNVSAKDHERSNSILSALASAGSLTRLVKLKVYSGEIPRTSTGKYRHVIDAREKTFSS